jgi:hypothetical protein
MLFTEGRGAAEITIINPGVTTLIGIRDLYLNINTLKAQSDSVIVTCGDQLQGVDIVVKEMLEATLKQCSMSPAFKTKVGSEANANISISSSKRTLFKAALNAKQYDGTGGDTGKTVYTIGDDSGTRTGTSTRPFKTIVFRPYDNGVPTPDHDFWMVFPFADIEGDVSSAFKIGEDRGYKLMATAYDPLELNYRVIIGSPRLIVPAQTGSPGISTVVTASTITSSGASIGWTDNGAASTSYVVQYKKSSVSYWTNANTATKPYALTGLNSGTSYDVRVIGLNAFGSGDNSTTTTFSTT